MADVAGFWQALSTSLAQVVAPTKSDDEIKLRQKAREAAAADDYAASLEKLAAHDNTKVTAGQTMLTQLKGT